MTDIQCQSLKKKKSKRSWEGELRRTCEFTWTINWTELATRTQWTGRDRASATSWGGYGLLGTSEAPALLYGVVCWSSSITQRTLCQLCPLDSVWVKEGSWLNWHLCWTLGGVTPLCRTPCLLWTAASVKVNTQPCQDSGVIWEYWSSFSAIQDIVILNLYKIKHLQPGVNAKYSTNTTQRRRATSGEGSTAQPPPQGERTLIYTLWTKERNGLRKLRVLSVKQEKPTLC